MTARKPTAALLLLLALPACRGVQSTLDPAGPAAGRLAHLIWLVIALFTVVAAIMWVLLGLVFTRRQGTFREHAPLNQAGGQGWMLVGGFALPTAILAVVFVIGLHATSKFPLHDGQTAPAALRVIGHRWWWDVRYEGSQVDQHMTTANEIHIPEGRAVDIDLASADVIHSFWIPQLHGKVDLVPGQTNRIRIEASRPGVYRGQCAEYCGAQHAHMALLVVVQPPAEYQRWLEEQQHNAHTPGTNEQQRGRMLFETRACALCHTIRGTAATGRVGPDLTHLHSRRMIAANTLRNNTANLAAWSTHAQTLKPGVAMPDVPQFSGEELRALTAYLLSLD